MKNKLFLDKTWFFTLSKNRKSLTSLLFLIYIPAILLLVILSLQTILPVSYLTRDPQVIAGVPFYTGLLSNVGVLMWCTTSAICLFTFLVFKKLHENVKMQSFFLYSGLLSLLLLVDDLWMVHEEVAPHYLNIPEKLIYLFYLGAVFVYFSQFFKIILKTEFFPLALAFFWFGLSILIDKNVLFNLEAWVNHEILYVMEDSCKLLGLISWCVYFVGVCLQSIQQIWVVRSEIMEGSDRSYRSLVLTK